MNWFFPTPSSKNLKKKMEKKWKARGEIFRKEKKKMDRLDHLFPSGIIFVWPMLHYGIIRLLRITTIVKPVSWWIFQGQSIRAQVRDQSSAGLNSSGI